jgi:hypothetical protein
MVRACGRVVLQEMEEERRTWMLVASKKNQWSDLIGEKKGKNPQVCLFVRDVNIFVCELRAMQFQTGTRSEDRQ